MHLHFLAAIGAIAIHDTSSTSIRTDVVYWPDQLADDPGIPSLWHQEAKHNDLSFVVHGCYIWIDGGNRELLTIWQIVRQHEEYPVAKRASSNHRSLFLHLNWGFQATCKLLLVRISHIHPNHHHSSPEHCQARLRRRSSLHTAWLWKIWAKGLQNEMHLRVFGCLLQSVL